MFRCHCRDCQQLTGTGHSEMVPLDLNSFVIGDNCSEYEMVGGSGQPTYSGFCPNCGSPLTRRSARMSDRIYVHAASMDHPETYLPAKSIYVDAAQPWDRSVIDQSAVHPA
ncbi:GFA family protein [Shimia abyssi]